jgi:ketosteroid isomerase-like protein
MWCSMKKRFALRKTLLLVPLRSAFAVRADAQSPQSRTPPEGLLRTIASLDGALFDAFNRCDLEKFSSFFVDDLEFYHDYDGLTVGRQNVTEAVKKNICGKVSRELVPGTLQVYPMRGYGAIEMGTHRFHHPKAEATEPVGEGKFVHLWQNKDGAWKITRVLSYDHHALPK